MLPVPTRAPGHSFARGVLSRLTRASLGSSRRVMAARVRPRARSVGRSFRLWTAASISPERSADSSSFVKVHPRRSSESGCWSHVAGGADDADLEAALGAALAQESDDAVRSALGQGGCLASLRSAFCPSSRQGSASPVWVAFSSMPKSSRAAST